MTTAVRALPYLLVLIAFALRIYRLDYQSIWRDEGVSLHLAASNIPAILANRASDVHPPLYFILLHFWTGLAGSSELSARFLSLFFSVLLIPSLYCVVRRVFGTRTALVTIAIAAFSPLYVVYSQETRTYALLPLCYLFIIHRLYQLTGGEELSRSAKVLSTSPLATEGRPFGLSLRTKPRPDFVARLPLDGAGTPPGSRLGKTPPGSGSSKWRWRHWIELAVVEVLCLHLHYFSVFAVAYLNLFIAALWLRRRQVNLHRWLSSQTSAALACAPWAWMVIRSWMLKGLPKPAAAGSTLRMTLFKQASFIWHFSSGGKHLWDHRLFSPLSSLLAVAFIVALPLAIRADRRRRQTLITLCHLIAPLSMVFILWWWKPLLSPNYIIMFTVPFFMLMGRAIVVSIQAGGLPKLAGVFLALTLAATFGLGLRIAFFDPTYFKDDARGLVKYLEPLANADADDLTSGNGVIIVHPIDYAVEYYYTGDASIAMIDPDDAQLMASLEDALREKRRAFLAWPSGTPLDMPGLLPFLLEMSGRFAGGEQFRSYSLRIYEPERAVFLPEIEPAWADFGDLRLTGAFYQDEVEADDAICLALRWQLARDTNIAHKVVVILWDAAGRRLSGADVLLTSPRWGLSTERWLPDQEELNYYIVPVPIGTPPLSYRITVGVYDADTMERLPFLDAVGNPTGKDFPLGEVVLTKAHSFERDPYGTRRHLSLQTLDEPEIADGLALEGFAISKGKARPQEAVSVTLRWRALRDGLPRYVPHLRLRRGGAIWAEVESSLFEEWYPTTEWAEGEVVFEQRDLVYPPKVGQAVLEMEVAGRAVTLGEMELDVSGLTFEAPPMQDQVSVHFDSFAELLGYDLDKTEATTSDKVRLTLYWRAINEEPLTTSYTVFTHLLSEDRRLIGQHDGIPAAGMRPTMSWVPGEVIADVHEMEFSDLEYRGKALIGVGLYESLTIERVPTDAGSDHLILPSEITVDGER